MLKYYYTAMIFLSIVSITIFVILIRLSKSYDETSSEKIPKLQLLAWYIPHFNKNPENSINSLVTTTNGWSKFDTANQSNSYEFSVRRPGELGFYNLLKKDVRRKQGFLAKEHGIDGFIYQHFWLENKPYMNSVLKKRLSDGEPNIPFSLCLMNKPRVFEFKKKNPPKPSHSTQKPRNHQIMLRMFYDEPDELFEYLKPFFRHKDYIKVDEKPVYFVFYPANSVRFLNFINVLRMLAVREGLKGLYIVQLLQSFNTGVYLHSWADAGLEYSPNLNVFGAMNNLTETRFSTTPHDILTPQCAYNLQGQNKPIFRGQMVSSDLFTNTQFLKNTSTSENREPPPPTLATIEKFQKITKSKLCRILCENKKNPEPSTQFFGFFSWNDWVESSTLEPSEQEGRGYLEALKNAKTQAMEGFPENCKDECAEIEKIEKIENCHAVQGCYSERGCGQQDSWVLLNREYGLDGRKGILKGDSGFFSFYRDIRMGVDHFDYFKEVYELDESQWSKTIKRLIDSDRVSNEDTNLLLIDSLCWFFLEERNNAVSVPWVGVIQSAGITLSGRTGLAFSDILQLDSFKESLVSCKGLIVLSPYWLGFVATVPLVLENDIPVFGVKHPVGFNEKEEVFTLETFTENQFNWKIVFSGFDNRRISSIYRLNTKYEKVWLTGFPVDWKMDLVEKKEKELEKDKVFDKNDVEILFAIPYHNYKNMLKTNIIVVDLWDVAISKTIFEVLTLKVPIFFRRLPPLVDYLGEGYPFFFNSVEELEGKLNKTNDLISLYTQGFEYLNSLDLTEFSYKTFGDRVDDVLKQISLPKVENPIDEGRLNSVFLIIPSLSTVENLKNVLQSIEKIKIGFNQLEMGFRCEVYVSDKSLMDSDLEDLNKMKSICSVTLKEENWSNRLLNVQEPKETYIILLSEHIKTLNINEKELINKMNEYNFDVISPHITNTIDRKNNYNEVFNTFTALEKRQGCSAHRTDFVPFYYVVLRVNSFLCLLSHLDPSSNPSAVGYDIILSDLCRARVGVLDDQNLEIVREEKEESESIGGLKLKMENETEIEFDKRVDESFFWLKRMLNFDDIKEVKNYYNLVLKTRPKIFPYCAVKLPSPAEFRWLTEKTEKETESETENEKLKNSHKIDPSTCVIHREPKMERPFFFFQLPFSHTHHISDILLETSKSLKVPMLNHFAYLDENNFHSYWSKFNATERQSCPFDNFLEPLACFGPKVASCALIFSGFYGVSLTKKMLEIGDTIHPSCLRKWEKPVIKNGKRRHDGTTADGLTHDNLLQEIPYHSFSCLVMLEDPRMLILNCYKISMKSSHGSFHDLSAEKKRKIIDYCGGNNLISYLGGVSPFNFRNNKTSTHTSKGSVEVAKKTIDHCVLGLKEKWQESLFLIEEYFPWIHKHSSLLTFYQNIPKNILRTDIVFDPSYLSENFKDFSDLIQIDMELYEYAKEKFEIQKKCFV